MLTFRLRSLHSLPEAWQPGSFPFTFTAALPLPLSSLPPSDRGIVLSNGQLKPALSKDPSFHPSTPAHWRWPPNLPPSVASQVAKIEPRPLEDEAGVWHGKSDIEFRQTAECELPKVTWNVQQRAWLFSNDIESFTSQVSFRKFYKYSGTSDKGPSRKGQPPDKGMLLWTPSHTSFNLQERTTHLQWLIPKCPLLRFLCGGKPRKIFFHKNFGYTA